MEIQTPTSMEESKNQMVIWIVVGLVVVCLCCLVVAGGIGIYYYLQVEQPAADAPVQPTMTTDAGWAPLQIESFSSDADLYLTPIYQLVPNYQGHDAPGVLTWNAQVRVSKEILVFTGWCTSTQEILDENMQHIRFIFIVDDHTISSDVLGTFESERAEGGYCHSVGGVVRKWPEGEHTIEITMRVDSTINDGWGDYAAGDYTDVYVIDAVP